MDLDQFYAAVEILDFPELKGRPLIVGGLPARRGVVSTASYEARAFGVHSAMPSARAAQCCPHAVWRQPRARRYRQKSREVHAVFARYTDRIEPIALDEAFLDLTGSQRLFGAPEKMARRIKDEILAETGLVASVGLAENKFLAKVASDLRKPDALVVVPRGAQGAVRFLAPLPIRRLWGVGPKTRARLEQLGLRTIGQLARAEARYLSGRLGAALAAHLLDLARGADRREVEAGGRPKSIGKERTFAGDLRETSAMERELLDFADNVAARLRAKRLKCLGLALKVRLGDFTTLVRSASFDEPQDLAEPLHEAAVRMLHTRVDRRRQGVRLLGLTATRLVGKGEWTPSLFADERRARRARAARAVDRLKKRFGVEVLTRARLLEERKADTGSLDDSPPEPGDGI